MLGKLRAHLTYANVVSSLCLFVLLGGVAWAASLPGNSVGPSQIKKNGVGASEIKKNAVRKSEIRTAGVGASEVQNGSLTASEFAPGVQLQGPPGATGPRGPSKAYSTSPSGQTVPASTTTVASLNLPAGNYVLLATAALFSGVDDNRVLQYLQPGCRGRCRRSPCNANDTVALSTAATNSGGAATFTCQSSHGNER